MKSMNLNLCLSAYQSGPLLLVQAVSCLYLKIGQNFPVEVGCVYQVIFSQHCMKWGSDKGRFDEWPKAKDEGCMVF